VGVNSIVLKGAVNEAAKFMLPILYRYVRAITVCRVSHYPLLRVNVLPQLFKAPRFVPHTRIVITALRKQTLCETRLMMPRLTGWGKVANVMWPKNDTIICIFSTAKPYFAVMQHAMRQEDQNCDGK
jgi:hypothetical protein